MAETGISPSTARRTSVADDLRGRGRGTMADTRRPQPELADDRPPLVSKRQVVAVVVRRGGPKVFEATLVPGTLFYVSLAWGGLGVAYVAALAWVYGCIGRRCVQRRPVSVLLVLAAIGLTARTAVAVWSGSAFVYFVQPVAVTVLTGMVFLLSLVINRPLIGRFAGDFWPMTPEMAANPGVVSLFRGLTLLWAGVNLTTAALTFGLLLSLPLAAFVAVKQVTGLGITVAAIAVT